MGRNTNSFASAENFVEFGGGPEAAAEGEGFQAGVAIDKLVGFDACDFGLNSGVVGPGGAEAGLNSANVDELGLNSGV